MPSCMAPYGGPVEPGIAVGGYKDNPQHASALVLTFIVNNHLNTEDLKSAMAWEKKYDKYSNSIC